MNGPAAGDMHFEGIVPAVLRAAERAPDAAAVIGHGRTMTYRQLVESAGGLASVLRERGVVGEPVAVPAVRGPDLVVALLGTLMAGSVYCPIDPAFPVDRQEAMARAAGCGVSISWDGATLTVGDPVRPRSPGDARPAARFAAPGPDDLAYILFTSGSTGRPRPVEVPHRAIDASVRSLVRLFAAEPADRFLQFASLSWDTCFEEMLPALTVGAALVFDDDAHSGSFARIVNLLARERISVLNLPTAFWHELVLDLVDSGARLPPSVRLLVIGGERVNPDRLAAWRDCGTGEVRLVNTYGCTETTLVTHAVDLHGPAAGPDAAGEAPIGRPLPHVQQRLEPSGAHDHLLIGGPSLAHGYRGDAAATGERFVSIDGERYFRTGDLVLDPGDGLLTYHGRADRQLKIRGVRVDPAEVEAEILRHTAAPAAAVIGVTVAGRTALVAFVVGGPDEEFTAGLLALLRRRLPAHLVPAAVLARPDLPRTTSGKTDYSRLTKEWSER
jgi:amino acid adenylation domain-containing protein